MTELTKRDGETLWIEGADGTRLAVHSLGGRGRPLVLLHAWGLSTAMWEPLVPRLVARDHAVFAVDRRGHGASSVADGGYDLPTLADDVTRALDAQDLHDVVLVGHSLGALEAVAVATGSARRRIGRLVLSAPATPCPVASESNPHGAPAEVFEADRARMRDDIGEWIRANTEGYWGVGEARPVDTAWTQQRLYRTPLRVLLAAHRTMVAADVREELRALTVPTRVIQGDADRSLPLALTGEPTAALLRDGGLRVFAGAGHGLYLSRAAEWVDAVA